jgi:hypothetical protein
MTAKRKKIKASVKYFGIEGVFYEKEAHKSFAVHKKSIAISNRSKDILLAATNSLRRKAGKLGLTYVGISDAFKIGGRPDHKVFLGRTAYYDYNSMQKAERLVAEFDFLKLQHHSSIFFISLVFFIEDKPIKDSFTIVFNIGIESIGTKLKDKINLIAQSNYIKNLIIDCSLDVVNAKAIRFVGVRWYEKIGRLGFFDSTEAVFKSIREVLKEVDLVVNIERKINAPLTKNTNNVDGMRKTKRLVG